MGVSYFYCFLLVVLCLSVQKVYPDKIHNHQIRGISVQCKTVINSPNFASWHCKALNFKWHDVPVGHCVKKKKKLFKLNVDSLNVVLRNLDKSPRISKKPWNKHVSSWEKHSNKRLVVHCNPALIFNSTVYATSYPTQNLYDLTHTFLSD